MSRLKKLQTYARLGPGSISRVGLYRLGLRTGLHPVLKLRADVAEGPFLRPPSKVQDRPPPNIAWDSALWRFGWHRNPLPDTPPSWFENPFSDLPQPDASHDWWRIPDFNSGDIKGLWELSRFDWVVAWATKAAHGDELAWGRLNQWLQDWSQKNPPYKGPNWKCGQEASIRVMHLVLAAWLLDQERMPAAGLKQLVATHLQRIAPTMSYAIGQRNNHGTSEAAALLIGGSFLSGLDPRAAAWARTGRRWLEERARVLIEPDGSFSQYSVNYHRVMLDTYALAEAWRRHRELPAFSDGLKDRLAAATLWLQAMTDVETGDAPNIGANDGARLIPLTDSDFRDFRPSVQLASVLFRGGAAYGAGPWDRPAQWLGVSTGAKAEAPQSVSFDDGGYHVLRVGSATAVLRYPRFRFRPSHADALHLDLWVGGRNLLRDAGTFSYNASGFAWYGGTAAHNTVEFDGRDQMPRLGRFLFGDWLQAEAVQPVAVSPNGIAAGAGYTDAVGARHHRTVTLTDRTLVCTDTLSGRFQSGCLRWRLAPGDWRLQGQVLRGGGLSVEMSSEAEVLTPCLATAAESRYYLQRAEIPVLELRLDHPMTIVTRFSF